MENDLKQRLQESRQRLESEIRSVLAEAISTAERARIVQAEGREAVGTAVLRLEHLHARLATLLAPDASPDLRPA